MKAGITFISILLILATASFAQETVYSAEFTGLRIKSGLNVQLRAGNSPRIEVFDDLPLLIEREGSTLTLKLPKGYFSAGKSKKVIVTYRALEYLEARSGAYVHSEAPLRISILDISAHGGANVKLEVDVDKLRGRSDGGASMPLRGQAEDVVLETSGGGNLIAKDLWANRVKASAASGGNLHVFVKESLVAQAVSGGKISYSGDPIDTNVDKQSGGQVRKVASQNRPRKKEIREY